MKGGSRQILKVVFPELNYYFSVSIKNFVWPAKQNKILNKDRMLQFIRYGSLGEAKDNGTEF